MKTVHTCEIFLSFTGGKKKKDKGNIKEIILFIYALE